MHVNIFTLSFNLNFIYSTFINGYARSIELSLAHQVLLWSQLAASLQFASKHTKYGALSGPKYESILTIQPISPTVQYGLQLVIISTLSLT